MKIKQIILANPDFNREIPEGKPFLEIAEFFCDTIQGENFIGYPASFLRLQHCTLNCVWCDTQEVWRYGNPYTFDEIFALLEKEHVIDKLIAGQHLVLTGGSPLKQQIQLIHFFHMFQTKYSFIPFIEVENECTLMPSQQMISLVSCWNNSPKLENSANTIHARYKPEIIKKLASIPNSWFKFVVSNKNDWAEIYEHFIIPGLITYSQIVLMPQGATRAEIEKNREMVLEIAIENNVRYSTREHIILWDKKTGV
jgi:organic radical activating enzyme